MLSLALRDKKGFTLVEVMIAMLILMVGLLAVGQVAMMVMDTNMNNMLRDDAVRIADRRINGDLRDTAGGIRQGLANLNHAQLAALVGASLPSQTFTVMSQSRSMQRPFTVVSQVQWADPSPGSKVFRVQVWVGWNYKGGSGALLPTGNSYQHSVSRLITREP